MEAGFGIRLGALLLDIIIVSMPLTIISLIITDGSSTEFFTGLLAFLYYWLTPVFWGGRTIGKWLCGIRIRKIKKQTSPGVFTMFVRDSITHLVYIFTFGIALIASVVMVLGREDCRALHDLIAGTEVVVD